MSDRFIIDRIFIPAENATLGSIVIKFAQEIESGKIYIGSGEDDWVIKNGMSLDDLNKFKLGV